MAEGLRREGGRRRGRLACTVFLAGGNGKGECRRVCSIAPRMRSRVRRTVRGGFELELVYRRKKKEGVADGVVDGDDDGDRK